MQKNSEKMRRFARCKKTHGADRNRAWCTAARTRSCLQSWIFFILKPVRNTQKMCWHARTVTPTISAIYLHTYNTGTYVETRRKPGENQEKTMGGVTKKLSVKINLEYNTKRRTRLIFLACDQKFSS